MLININFVGLFDFFFFTSFVNTGTRHDPGLIPGGDIKFGLISFSCLLLIDVESSPDLRCLMIHFNTG